MMPTKKHPTEIPESDEKSMKIPLVGMGYRLTQLTQKKLRDNAPIRVKLEREPGNTHDRNAIKVTLVTFQKGLHVGYVPRDIAKTLAPKLDDGSVEITTAWLSSVDHLAGGGQLVVSFRRP